MKKNKKGKIISMNTSTNFHAHTKNTNTKVVKFYTKKEMKRKEIIKDILALSAHLIKKRK